jgi:transposase-like protein
MSKPGVSPRHFSNESQERIVLRLEGGETIAAVAGETGVRRKLRRDAYQAMGTAGFNRKRGPKVMKGGLPPPQVAEMSCYSAG